MVAKCQFPAAYVEEAMRDVFIFGLADRLVEERLMDGDISKLNFSIAQSRAEIMERAQRDLHVEQPVCTITKNKLIGRSLEKPLIECKRCGRKHDSGHYPAEGKECFLCKKKGHFQNMCRSSNNRKIVGTISINSMESDGSESLVHTINLLDQRVTVLVDTSAQVGKAQYFSTLDMRNGYWHIEVHEDDRALLAFGTPFGTFTWRRLPFGLKSAPMVFQDYVCTILDGLGHVMIHLYDILLATETMEEHLQRFFSD
jgi:hypothetical protein